MKRQIFAYGGQINREFIKYTAELTGKSRPRICFLPTALADSKDYAEYWYQLCRGLDLIPEVMGVWISTYSQEESFEEKLLRYDAIMVGGGNTLNMLAIWRAQEIDKALRKAYEKGIVLAGGSAGSLCWFHGGNSDSRPGKLSFVAGLNFLPFSHCPHYHSEASRRPMYMEEIKAGNLKDGYACDDLAGILFVNEEAEKALTTDQSHAAFYIYKDQDTVKEKELPAELIY